MLNIENIDKGVNWFSGSIQRDEETVLFSCYMKMTSDNHLSSEVHIGRENLPKQNNKSYFS